MKSSLCLLVISLIGLFFGSKTYSCSCVYIETFCESIGPSPENIYADLIILGRVLRIKRNGMEVGVRDLIYGDLKEAIIFVRRGNGADCGVDTDFFEPNDEYLFSLYERNGTSEDPVYGLSICGVNYLPVIKGEILGPISSGKNKQSYNDFRLGKGCPIIGSFPNTPLPRIATAIYPNPTNDKVNLQFDKAYQEIFYTLFDLKGRKITKGVLKEIIAESTIEISLPIGQMLSGIYLLELNGMEERQVIKLLYQ